MTQDKIIEMAREAGLIPHEANIAYMQGNYPSNLERFAALVAANERNRHAWTQEHWTEYEHAIAAAEREACAKVCDKLKWHSAPLNFAENCAAALRARSKK